MTPQTPTPAPEIRATRMVRAPQDEVFDFLADLEKHWRLADRFIEVLGLQQPAGGRPDGGWVRIRGPLGVRRTAATRVLAADPPDRIIGVAELGRTSRAFVRWELRDSDGATRVRLEATIDRTGWLDQLLLLLGARVWLERRFGAVLDRLAEAFRLGEPQSNGKPPADPAAHAPQAPRAARLRRGR